MRAEGRYTYTVLRYVHDLGTSEFLNAGVVVASCDAPYLTAKFKTTCERIKDAFPSLDAEIFLSRMKRLQACFESIDAARCAELRAREGPCLAALIRCVLPLEDRALYWSPTFSGVGGPLAATLESLYERCVMRHDSSAHPRTQRYSGRKGLLGGPSRNCLDFGYARVQDD